MGTVGLAEGYGDPGLGVLNSGGAAENEVATAVAVGMASEPGAGVEDAWGPVTVSGVLERLLARGMEGMDDEMFTAKGAVDGGVAADVAGGA